MNKKYETCVHATSVGQTAVFVTTSCPRAIMIKGTLVSSKDRCVDCKRYEKKVKRQQDKGRKEHDRHNLSTE